MTEHQKRVKEFMIKAGQSVRPGPTSQITDEERILRAKLTLEEALEKIDAMGVSIYVGSARAGNEIFLLKQGECSDLEVDIRDSEIEFIADGQIDLEKWLDGICDLSVVNTGDLVTLGIDGEKPQELVDEANLNKFSPGGYRREDGKWIKPPDWQPPALVEELRRQGCTESL